MPVTQVRGGRRGPAAPAPIKFVDPIKRPVFIVDRADDEGKWLDARAHRVTATDVARLVAGGIQTRRAILDDKLNGSSFRGNAATDRGHRREEIVADWVQRHFGIEPNSALWAHPDNDLHAATPDGISDDSGAEIKSTVEDWVTGDIPQDYLDQVQWNIYVRGVDRWLFVWEPLDEHGQYPLEPLYRWIGRDDARIEQLVASANRFIEWRAAGAPLVDLDIPEVLDELISQHVAARRGKKLFETREKIAEAAIRNIIAADKVARVQGCDRSGHDGGLLYTVKPQTDLDLDVWAQEQPLVFAEWEALTEAAAALRAAAEKVHQRPIDPYTRLVIAEHKPTKAATP